MDAFVAALTEYKFYFIAGAVIAGVIWGAMKLIRRSHSQTQQSGAKSVNVQAGRDAKIDRTKID